KHSSRGQLSGLNAPNTSRSGTLDHCIQVHARRAQRRNQAEENSRQQRYHEREKQNSSVWMKIEWDGRRARGNELQQHLIGPLREEQAQSTSRQRQHQALREELLCQSSAAGP